MGSIESGSLRAVRATALCIGVAAIVGACATPVESNVSNEGESVATTAQATSVLTRRDRPLVGVVAAFPGPTAAAGAQWFSSTTTINGAIPDNKTTGIASTAYNTRTPTCRATLQARADVSVSHPRHADLVVQIANVNGTGVAYSTATLWDGPAQAAGKTPMQIAALSIPGELVIPLGDMTASTDCSRFRLTVIDKVAGNTGTLQSWTFRQRVAWDPIAHDDTYYSQLLFGGRTPNLSDYHREESRGRFYWTKAGPGIVGPVAYDSWQQEHANGKIDESNYGRDAASLLAKGGFDFRPYDTNHDGTISDTELGVVLFQNDSTNGWGQTGFYGCVPIPLQGVQFCGQTTRLPEQPDFDTLAHETTHQLGAHDLYASGCYSSYETIMSCSVYTSIDDARTLYADAWHRVKFGWLTPSVASVAATGSFELGDEAWRDKTGLVQSSPLKMVNPADATEYYLFEYRTRRGYDRNLGSEGVIAWHVKEDASGEVDKGADGSITEGYSIYAVGPDGDKGAHQAWNPSDGRFRLKWANGMGLPKSFWLTTVPASNTSLMLRWDAAPTDATAPRVTIVRPTNGTHGTYGLGTIVEFAAVATDARGSGLGFTYHWSSDTNDGPFPDGATTHYAFGSPGARTISVLAIDRYGARSGAKVQYVADSVGPSVTITSPAANTTIAPNQPITLHAIASNPSTFGLGCAAITWTLDVAPWWSANECTVEATPPSFSYVGFGTFTATATDRYGSASARLTVDFVEPPPSSPPVVTVTSPQNDIRIMMNQTYTVSGTVIDPQNGVVSYSWAVLDENRNVWTQLAPTSSSFQFMPNTVMTTRGYMQIRLRGTNARGQWTDSSIRVFNESPIF